MEQSVKTGSTKHRKEPQRTAKDRKEPQRTAKNRKELQRAVKDLAMRYDTFSKRKRVSFYSILFFKLVRFLKSSRGF